MDAARAVAGLLHEGAAEVRRQIEADREADRTDPLRLGRVGEHGVRRKEAAALDVGGVLPRAAAAYRHRG